MIFSSPIFLFLFLPIVFASYFLVRGNIRTYILLVASIIFYTWGEPRYVVLMIVSIIFNYFLGIKVEKLRLNYGNARLILALGVFLNIGLLIFFKYFNFIFANLNNISLLFGGSLNLPENSIHLPIGISFYTFHSLSYIIDIYRSKAKAQRNIFKLALYISFFPQLIAGPIIRYHDICDQLESRNVKLSDVSYGIRRFIVGLGKKLIIADTIGAVSDQIFSIPVGDLTVGISWLGILCYGLQIYYDFSAYSDMAIGLASMFGFKFLENFNYPYVSKDIREFWKRWHISLSNWFRDYLYIPLGGNRASLMKTYRNLLIVFFLCGLWHGASWNFIIWGLYHGFFLVLERTKFGDLLNKMWKPLRHVYALFIITISWVFFRSESFYFSVNFIKAMFGFGQGTGKQIYAAMYLTNELAIILIIAIFGCIPLFPAFLKLKEKQTKYKWAMQIVQDTAVIFLLVISIIFMASYFKTSANIPFIYFKF